MIYDNGTVTQQATALSQMANKAKQFDSMQNRGMMKSAFNEGANVAATEADGVIQGLAERLGTMEGELAVRDQRDAGLAGASTQPQIKGY